MAVPSLGKCVVLLVFVLIIYTGYAFRIRDAVQPTGSTEHARSNVCSGGQAFGKCPGDPRADSASTSLPTSRRKYERLDNDASRARIASKSHQPPVEDEASEESVQDDDGGNVGKTSSYFSSDKIVKWMRNAPNVKKVKFGRSAAKEQEDEDESEEAVVTEEDDGDNDNEETDEDDVEEIDADSDDDGVEVSNGDDSEESGETVVIDADEDDEDEDEDDDESQEASNENGDEEDAEDDTSRSDEETKNDDVDNDDDDYENEDEITKAPVKKVPGKYSTHPLKGSISRSKRHEKDEDDSEEEIHDREKTVDRGKKVAQKSDEDKKEDSGEDDELDHTKSEVTKKQSTSKVVKESGKQVDKESKQKSVKKDESEENDDDVDDEETDEDEDDEDNESAPTKVASPPLRKLEKVRLADKDKVKSMEVARTTKPVSVVPEKPAVSEESAKKIEETTKSKKKDTDEVTKATKSEVRKSTSPVKSEANAKSEISSKPVKDTTSKKSDKTVTPKSATTKNSTKSDVEKIEKPTVGKKKDDKSEIKGAVKKSEKAKLEASPALKTGGKKMDVSSGVDKKDQSKTKAKKRADASISLTELNDSILRVPTFVPNFTAVEDPVCRQHGKIFLRQLRGYKLWALQMLDSSAKIPSGLLRGNINQLGDFDQCLGITARVKVNEKTVKVQGKYCLATLDLHASLPDMKVPVNFMQSRGFIRGSMRDPGHFVPRFTTANWAMCIPAACSAEDARSAIESALSHVNVSSGLRFTIDVDPEMCYVRQKGQTYSKETIGVLYFYAMIICVVLVATVRDYAVNPQGKGNYSERIIMSFSLRRTLRILTKEGRSDAGEISCIHGIRSLATVALYVAHKMIPISQIPYANRISLTEVANSPISSVLRASLVYTDCFLLLSGVLTAFNMARESTKRGEIRWFCRFVARFMRLTPALLVMVFWYAYVMEHTGSGPQWNSVVVANAELCKQNSWTNLLYIQNFFPFEEMCATHTHQLALDMQLSLLAPIFVFFLTLKPIVGILLVFFILQVSATLRYFATTSNYLSLVIFHGMTMKHLYKTANLTYALPLHRATPYMFGVGLGVLLHYTGKNVRIYRIFAILGWLIAAALGSWSLFSPWRMARRDYSYDVEEAAHYAVIAPVSWSLALCWIIFACFTDHGGFVNKFLSSYWMTLFSRISYAVYLCQFAIFFYNVGTTRYSTDFQVHRFIDPYEAIVVTLVSVILTLFIDIPMQEVKNVILESTDGLTIPIAETEPTPESQEATTTEKSAVPIAEEFHPEQEEEVAVPHWDPQDDAIDGLTRVEDSADEEEPTDKWPRQPKSNGRRRSYVRRETYEDEEEEEEEDDESERAEWDWVKRPGSRMSVEDDGLVERGRRSRSSQRPSYIEPDTGIRESSAYLYQREDDYRRERRSLSRQPDRTLRREESPRGSLKRERSTSRAPEFKMTHPETEDQSSFRQFSSRPETRFYGREYEQTTTSSWETRRERSPRRERSTSRVSESKIMQSEVEDLLSERQFSRSESRGSFSGREYEPTAPSSRETEMHERSPRPSTTPRREPIRLLSSGSDDDPTQHQPQQQQILPKILKRQPSEPKVSDEEDWEQELRIRRRKFMERLASEDRETKPQPDEGNDGWDSVKRRSSAEGKLALLKDPTGSNVMDSWTVSRGPRVSLLGSSQETEDDGSYVSPQKDYRESRQETPLKEDDRSEEDSGAELSRRRSYTSGSQVTSLEEEEDDVANNDFVLKKGSKRITVMDLSKLSQQEGQESEEETAGWKVVKEEEAVEDEQPKMATLKLFKRESIVKSQASEEDPEYLLPERPKLMEQEQDHPFKKAWQLQKSRSEEDGPSAYALKEVKAQPDALRNRKQDKEKEKNEDKDKESTSTKTSSGGQSILENSYNDDEMDTTTVWLSRSVDVEDSRSSSKSGNETDSSRLDWPSEDEQFNRYKLRRRRLSEEANYDWELEET